MSQESASGTGAPASVTVRPFRDDDRPFFRQVVDRLIDPAHYGIRDPHKVDEWKRRLAEGELPDLAGATTVVAVDETDQPLGILVVHPDTDFFTGHPRAVIEVLLVAAHAEGRGVGSTLLEYAEQWARAGRFREIVLDVFAGNERAIAVYRRNGFDFDHHRLTKPL